MRKNLVSVTQPGRRDPLEKAAMMSNQTGALIDALRAPVERESLHEDSLLSRSLRRVGQAAERKALFDAWEEDIDLVAMTWALMQAVPVWKLEERVRGKGLPENRIILESFFHLPDGRQNFQNLLRVTVGRYKLLGDAYWLLKKPSEQVQEVARRSQQMARVAANRLSKALRLPGGEATRLEGALTVQFQKQLDRLASLPPGFEFLDGDVERVGDEYVQTVSFGRSKTYSADRVIEFRSPSPRGGVFNIMKALLPYSRASVRVFQLNRAGAQTGGMADMLIAIDGISDAERRRLEQRMMSRADPRRDIDQYLPLIVRAQSLDPDQRVRLSSVRISERERDAKWGEWDRELRVRKSGAMQVALSQVGEWRTVNRATKDQSKRDLIDEALALTSDICNTVTERIIVETFGIEDWVLTVVPPDLRDAEFAHKQDLQDQENGVLSLWDRWSTRHGVNYAEEMAERLATLMGADTELVKELCKVPQLKVGKEWIPVTDILPLTAVTSATSVAVEPPPVASAQEPAETDNAVEEDNTEADSATTSTDEPVATPEQMLAALDVWQKAAVTALRKTGIAYDPESSVRAQQVLPSRVHEYIDQLLYYAETPADVSNAFVAVRRAVRAGGERLAKVSLPQSQAKMFYRLLEEAFAGVREDARRALQSAARGLSPEFETEPE